MSRQQEYIDALRENLRIDSVESCGLYQRGVGSAVIPMAGEGFGYLASKNVRVYETDAPELSQRTREIIEARTPTPKVNNPIPFLRRTWGGEVIPIVREDDVFELPLYIGTFKDWRGTLPRKDQYDSELIKADLMTPFNTTAVAVTRDGYFFAPERSGGRQSHSSVLCLLNGYRLDRDIAENTLACHKEIVEEGTGRELERQSMGCVAFQLNIPLEKVLESRLMGLGVSEPAINDYGYHTLHLARVDLDRQEVVDAANEIYGDDKHSRYLRIRDEHVIPFEADSLVMFANKAPEKMAMTQIPAIWVALANQFGERHLRSIEGLVRN